MDNITLASLGTVVGGTAAVSLVILVLKAVLPGIWSSTINRIVALVLSIAFVEVAVFAAGAGNWQTYLLGFFTGCQVCLATLNGTAAVTQGIITGASKAKAWVGTK